MTGVFAYLQFLQTQRTTFDNFISQQVAKAFDEIGNSKIEVRIGGIYTLEGALQVNNFYRIPVLQALSAFVRGTANQTTSTQLQADVQAAMIVIGRNLTGADFLYFQQLYLVRADLVRADLRKANFAGSHLNESNLYGSNLDGANLTGVDLTGASLVRFR
jgi:uncharacterized protein YjbI with pentapeptide repeats